MSANRPWGNSKQLSAEPMVFVRLLRGRSRIGNGCAAKLCSNLRALWSEELETTGAVRAHIGGSNVEPDR